MPSVYDCFEETSIDIMIVTETWFYDCAALERLMINSEKGNGIKMVNFCRKRKGKMNSGGGVSILYREGRAKVSEYKMKRRGHEVVIVRAKLANNTRPMYIIGTYLSKRLSGAKGAELLTLINEGIHKIKSENANPYIIVAGDFNRWDVEKAYEDFEDWRRSTRNKVWKLAFLYCHRPHRGAPINDTNPSVPCNDERSPNPARPQPPTSAAGTRRESQAGPPTKIADIPNEETHKRHDFGRADEGRRPGDGRQVMRVTGRRWGARKRRERKTSHDEKENKRNRITMSEEEDDFFKLVYWQSAATLTLSARIVLCPRFYLDFYYEHRHHRHIFFVSSIND